MLNLILISPNKLSPSLFHTYSLTMFEGNPIVVDHIHIPSDNPFFLAIISIHIIAAFICVLSGVIAMFANKQPGIHPKAGSIYFWSLLIVFVTVTVIAIGRWKEDYYLFLLGLISFGLAFIGRIARKKLWQKWSILHISCMGLSYIILITAFYVDNGKFLPIWENFPSLVYWVLPSLIGVPIIIRTLFRHPLSKDYFKRVDE